MSRSAARRLIRRQPQRRNQPAGEMQRVLRLKVQRRALLWQMSINRTLRCRRQRRAQQVWFI